MKRIWVAVAMVMVSILPATTVAGLFLWVDGIAGECADINHMNWIELDTFSHGAVWGGTSAAHEPLIVTYVIDKSIPVFNIRACDNLLIPSLILELTQSGDTAKAVYKVTLWDAHVRSVEVRGDNTAGGQTATVAFDFGRIEWRYIPYDGSGNPLTHVTAGWNVTNNVAL